MVDSGPEDNDYDDLFNVAFLDEPEEEHQAEPQAAPLFFPSAPSEATSALHFPAPVAPSHREQHQEGLFFPLHLPAPAAPPENAICGTIAPSQLYLPSAPISALPRPTLPIDSHFATFSPPEAATSPESAASPNAEVETASSSKRKKKKRVNWTDEESERLIQGVEQYGIGNWSRICSDKKFNLGHRKNVDLKDRFRTIFPDQYRMHNDRLKTKEPVQSVNSFSSAGTSTGNPILLELDYRAAKIHKKLNRKRIEKRVDKREKIVPPPRPDASTEAGLTTARGRRKVLRKKDVDWSAEEDADLPLGFQKYKRRWRLMAADRRLAFYGRTIIDIKERFHQLFPELLEQTLLAPQDNPVPSLPPQDATFEQGLINGFGTAAAGARRPARPLLHIPQGSLQHQPDPAPSHLMSPILPGTIGTHLQGICEVPLAILPSSPGLLSPYPHLQAELDAENRYSPLPVLQQPSPPATSCETPPSVSVSPDPGFVLGNISSIGDLLLNIQPPAELDTHHETSTASVSPVSRNGSLNCEIQTPLTSFASSPASDGQLEALYDLTTFRVTSPVTPGPAASEDMDLQICLQLPDATSELNSPLGSPLASATTVDCQLNESQSTA